MAPHGSGEIELEEVGLGEPCHGYGVAALRWQHVCQDGATKLPALGSQQDAPPGGYREHSSVYASLAHAGDYRDRLVSQVRYLCVITYLGHR